MSRRRSPIVSLPMILAAIIALTGCDSRPDHFDRHVNDHGYSISYPKDWRTTTEGSTADTAVFRAIGPAIPSRSGNPNMNVVSFPLEPGFELSTAPASARSMREDVYSHPKLISEEWTTLDGERAFRCEYTGTAHLPQGSIRLHMIWYYTVKDHRAYNLTLASPADRMGEYRDELEAIAESFRFES